MIPHDVLERLPKANLVTVRWHWRPFYFAIFRLANARQFEVGWLSIIVRAPWLENVARSIYPHFFESQLVDR